MLVAKDGDGKRIDAHKAKRFCDKGDYHCPRCDEPVYTRKGRMVIDHFSHYPRTFTKCGAWEPETKTHLLMKDTARRLFTMPRVTIEVEKRVGDLWPDLLITLENGEKIAVECQHSRRSAEMIEKRTRELEKHVNYVVWIYSTSNFDRKDGEFFFDAESKQLGFNSKYLRPSGLQEGAYVILSDEIRNKLDMSLINSIFVYPQDLARYQEVVGKYKRRGWLEKKEKVEMWLKAAKKKMRNDEIDELFGINDLIPQIKRRYEEWEEALGELLDELQKGEPLRESYEEHWSYHVYEEVKERFVWLWGRLRKRDNLISTLTEAQEESLIKKVSAVKKLGFESSRYKPGLFHKSFYTGWEESGAVFLDFRKITKIYLKPRFYFTDDMPRLAVGQELVSNSPVYHKIGLDFRREIKKIGIPLWEIKKSIKRISEREYQKNQRKRSRRSEYWRGNFLRIVSKNRRKRSRRVSKDQQKLEQFGGV